MYIYIYIYTYTHVCVCVCEYRARAQANTAQGDQRKFVNGEVLRVGIHHRDVHLCESATVLQAMRREC